MEPEEPIQNGPTMEPEITVARDESETPRPDAHALVARMIEAGEWPEPALMEQIVAAGEAAIEPLLEVLRTRPDGWPDEAPLSHALGLVSMIRPAAALPLLVELGRHYMEETGEEVGNALASYGQEGIDSLLELCRDPAIRGYHRLAMIGSAVSAAGTDPVLRAGVAEPVREILAQTISRYQTRLKRASTEQGAGEQKGEVEDKDEIYPTEEIAFLISDLCDMADPLAVAMIDAALDEKLVASEIVNRKYVKETYEMGGRVEKVGRPWLEDYRASYLIKHNPVPKPAESSSYDFPSRTSYPSFDAVASRPPPPRRVDPIATIRNVAAKIGRNDLCWCGSGKKYKKCHMGKDAPT
jgi:hypothetical protein